MKLDRAAVNRANALHSTGPKTAAGKQRSAANALRHGLYSSQVVLPHEDVAAYEAFRASLHQEHQPACPTEEFLVDEIAQCAWRLRRFRNMEAHAFASSEIDGWVKTGLLPLIMRALASAERAFHRNLAALVKAQRERGFFPASRFRTAGQTTAEAAPSLMQNDPQVQAAPAGQPEANGFVSSKLKCDSPSVRRSLKNSRAWPESALPCGPDTAQMPSGPAL